ncbi:MAG TPA: efflux RND transporter periplasmic adaptor subunit, partial [Bdellovibrionales bacterium]|nr:efflux RND transporter periplasmic adaptor subunit [Bdellovibrionales bacterium]
HQAWGQTMKWLILILVALSPAARANPKTVFVNAVKPQELFDVLTYPARVESKVNAQVYSESDGVVTKILMPVGERVKSGEKILVVKHTDPLYNYAPVALTSPVAGVVSQIKVTVGSRVNKGQLLVSVTDPTSVHASLEAAALDLAVLKKGLEGEAKVQGRAETLKLEIARISPFVDPATGTATAEVEFVSKKDLPPPGSVVQVSFKVNPRHAIVLPEHAIFYRGSDSFVRLVESGKSKRVPVKLGRRQRGRVEVSEGLKTGDQVIERASGFIADGDEVKIEVAEDAKAAEGNKAGG